MNKLIEHIRDVDGSLIAIQTETEQLSYAGLSSKISEVKSWLASLQASSVVLCSNNSIDWVLMDLACQSLGIIITPVPGFFSESQLKNVIAAVRPELILSNSAASFKNPIFCPLNSLQAFKSDIGRVVNAPQGTSKVTFTSGSTGNPKGVCLSADNQMKVAEALVQVIGIDAPKHLSLLPLSTLLENIAGVYAPLLANGTVVLPSEESTGFVGSKLASPEQLVRCISSHQPHTLILVPELLQLLIRSCDQGWQVPDSLQFVAVGGSKVSPQLIHQAKQRGIPVCQGYGLSECASVVSLCTSNDDEASSGKILPHLNVEIVNTEIVVKGNSFLGYLEQPSSWGNQVVKTGDIGKVINGRLVIEGRLKNTIITSYGRNISPEWIEAELLASGAFSQAVLVGDAKPFCSALLVPVLPDASENQLRSIVAKVNASLPDYAQIHQPIFLSSPMSAEQGLYTENMRPKRKAIQQFYSKAIEEIYLENHALESLS